MKKIKILIADDRKPSADTIINYAFQPGNGLQGGAPKHRKAIEDTLEIKHFTTVGAAARHIAQHPEAPFDLAFVDMDFSETDGSETQFRETSAKLRGVKLLQVLRKDSPETKIKVHTRYGTVNEVFQALKKENIHLNDLYDLMTDGDEVIVRGDLHGDFPRLLREVAQNIYYRATERAAQRTILEAEIRQNMREATLERPLQALDGFCLRTLLAGWWVVQPDNDSEAGYTLALSGTLEQAVRELCSLRGAFPDQTMAYFNPAGNLRRLHPRTGDPEIGYKRLTDLRENPGYAALRQEIEARARVLVLGFLARGWGQATEANIREGVLPGTPQAFEPMPPTVYPDGLVHHLGGVNGVQDSPAFEALRRVLIGRLVLLSLYGLKNAGRCFQPLHVTRVVEIAILAAIRNNPHEARGNHREVVDNCFNVLLGFRRDRQGAILPESILPEEHAWVQNLAAHFPAHYGD
jgi:hypothetical protein